MKNQKYNCIVNRQCYDVREVEQMGVEAFWMEVSKSLPQKIYKYFPNTVCKDKETRKQVNYSKMALTNNTIHVSNPREFDDIFDSNIHCDKDEFIKYRLMAYCERCGVKFNQNMNCRALSIALAYKFKDYYDRIGNMDNLLLSTSKVQEESDISFLLKLRINLDKYGNWQDAIVGAIEHQYTRCLDFINQQFNVACFSTSPFSTLMWGGLYGNCHKGFCVEYTLNDELKDNIGFNISRYLMPMVYCSNRPNIAKILSENEDQTPNKQWLWNIMIHGILRKDINWSFQDEWRFWAINRAIDQVDNNIKFYPISKVYLGKRMGDKERKSIMRICGKLTIPVVGIRMKSNVYELEECEN